MNEELLSISAAFDEVLEDSLPLDQLLDSAASDTVDLDGARSVLTEMGIHTISIPEEAGGFGGSPAWIASLMLVAGRRLLPPVLRDEAFLLAPLLASLPGDEQAAAWLEGLIDGSTSGAVAAVVAGSASSRVKITNAETACNEIPIWAPHDPSVVGLITKDGAWLFDAADKRVHLEPCESVDPGQGAHLLTVDAGPVSDALRIDRDDAARILRSWELALLAEAVGCSEQLTEVAAEYAVERHQFGRPIATFQSVAHLLADMKQRTELGRSVVSRLVSLIEREAHDEVDDLVAAARLWVPGAAREVGETAIQVQGGMGFTWEMGTHLWYRRALHIQAILGGSHGAAAAAGAHFVDRARAAAGIEKELSSD